MALGGLVTGFRQNVTKKGEMMASFVLEDLTGGIEVLVFPRVYAQTRALGNDQGIVVVGKYIIRDDERKIFAEKITKLEDLKPSKEFKPPIMPKSCTPQTVEKRLFLRFTNDKSDLMQTVLSILQRFPGSQPVYFYFEDNQKVIEGNSEFWINDGDELKKALQEVMGQRNVVWKPAKNFA